MRRNQTCKDQGNTEVFKEHKEDVEFGALSTRERQGFDRRIKVGKMGLIRPSRLSWAVLRRYIYIYIFFFFKLWVYLFVCLFIYLFMVVLGLRFCARAFSSCCKRGPLFIAMHGPLTIAASLVAEHRLQTRRLSNCGSQA